jgi:hypothetical protein
MPRPKQPTPKEVLQDLLYPSLTADVLEVRQSLTLLDALSANAPTLDGLNYGPLFGPIGLQAVRHIDLALAKIFDPPDPRHPTRSIPVVLDLLDTQAGALPFHYRDFVEQKLSGKWFRLEALRQMTEPEVTRALVAYFRAELPDDRRSAFHASSKALSSVKLRRNKQVAHNERFDRAKIPGFDRDDATALLTYAEDFVTLTGQGYLGLVFEFDRGERPFFTTDGTIIGRALSRLVRSLSSPNPDEE